MNHNMKLNPDPFTAIETGKKNIELRLNDEKRQQIKIGDTITFTNTAKGLNAVDVGKLFDRFYTVETGRKSTGLGLSIAKILTERMDGTIYAE